MRFILIAIALAMIPTICCADEHASRAHEIQSLLEEAMVWRTWTSKSGNHTVDAGLVDYLPNGKLELDLGAKTIIVERKQLSKDDQQFVRMHKQAFADARDFEYYNEITVADSIERYKIDKHIVQDQTPIPDTHYDKVNARKIELNQNRVVRMNSRAERRAWMAQEIARSNAARTWSYNPVVFMHHNQPLYIDTGRRWYYRRPSS